ncbi:ATP-binding protein [Streptomyces sp. NPDC053431]|uniref:ATP-binding protein n=1 Tax=Streptomyces sp. NPDC053431 TaxID=3365703 RepID=UPI0037D723E3
MNSQGDARSDPQAPVREHRVARGLGEAHVRTSAQARRSIRRALEPGATAAQVDDVLLVASELVTNAQRHAGGVTGFGLAVGRDSVTVSVSDSSRRTPRYTLPRDLRPGGFGWPIVLHLCREVTVDVRPEGKTVRAVVPVDRWWTAEVDR